jgi:hypothetical protein
MEDWRVLKFMVWTGEGYLYGMEYWRNAHTNSSAHVNIPNRIQTHHRERERECVCVCVCVYLCVYVCERERAP